MPPLRNSQIRRLAVDEPLCWVSEGFDSADDNLPFAPSTFDFNSSRQQAR